MGKNSGGGGTIFSRAFVSIFIVNFTLLMGQFMVGSLVTKYAVHMGATTTVAGTVGSMFALTALAIRPISGPAINSLSKRRLIMLTSFLTAVAFAIYGTARSIPVLIAGRFIHGFGAGVSSPLALAIASESLPEEKMSSGIGVFTLAQAVATAIGPNIGLTLARTIGYSKTFYIGSTVTFCACLLTLIIPENKKIARPPFKISLNTMFEKRAIVPAAMMMLLNMAYGCINSYMAIYGEARGVQNIGLFFTAYAIALVVIRPIVGRIADKKGLTVALIPGFFFFAVAFAVVGVSASLPMFILAGVLSAFGYGTVQPNVQSLAMGRTTPDRRGLVANTTSTGSDIGLLISGPVSGMICDAVNRTSGNVAKGYSVVYFVMIIPVALCATIYLVDVKRRKKAAGKGE